MAHREDWRKLPLITIDPADAKDHDDAVYAEPDTSPDNPGGVIVVVAIADVSWYVRPGSPLDREALASAMADVRTKTTALQAFFQSALAASIEKTPAAERNKIEPPGLGLGLFGDRDQP